MKPDAFSQFLFSQLPYYDDAIIRDIRPTSGFLRAVDHYSGLPLHASLFEVQKMPSPLRQVMKWRYFQGKSWKWIAAKLDVRPCQVGILYRIAKAYYSKVNWSWGGFGKLAARNVGLKSDWPPPKKLNCVVEPEDPWAPMRHWDD